MKRRLAAGFCACKNCGTTDEVLRDRIETRLRTYRSGGWIVLLGLLGAGCAPYCPAATARQTASVLEPTAPPSTDGAVHRPTQAPEAPRLRPCLEEQSGACGRSGAAEQDAPDAHASALPIGPDDPVRGEPDAPVAVIVYSDFQCPYCARLTLVLQELLERQGERARLIWKDLPSARHPQAAAAALLARQAFAEHGAEAFWRMHDTLFAQQSQLSEEWLERLARDEGLSWPPSGQYRSKLERSLAEADALGVAATPTTFIGDQVIVGAKSLSVYEAAIEQALAQQPR